MCVCEFVFLSFYLIIQRDATDLGESMIDTAQVGLTVIVEPDRPRAMLITADEWRAIEPDQLKNVKPLSFKSFFCMNE